MTVYVIDPSVSGAESADARTFIDDAIRQALAQSDAVVFLDTPAARTDGGGRV